MASEAPTVSTDMELCGPLLWTRLEVAVEARGGSTKARVFFHSADGGHLQEGPTCGFVALFLAAKSAGLIPSDEYIVNIADALAWARMVGFSNIGEMFSTEWLSRVGSSFYTLGTFKSTPFPEAVDIVAAVNDEKIFVVPYDCDKNFEPTNRAGEGAHWAAVVGYAVFKDGATDDGSEQPNIAISQLTPDESAVITADELFVIAYQGKSKHPALWKYTTLKESNLQLNHADPTRIALFRLPQQTSESDVELHGLCGKAVLVEKQK